MDLSSNFSPNYEYFASTTQDGLLKIYNVHTSNIKQQFTPSAHLSTTCTCLSWAPRELIENVKTKRRKKSRQSITEDSSDFLALGTLSGQLYIYSVKNDNVQIEFENNHTKRINSICWSEDGCQLYTGSNDQYVFEWQVSSGKSLRKLKAEKNGVKALTICHHHKYLITSSVDINIWSMNLEKRLFTLSSHTGFIHRLITFKMNDGPSLLISAAIGDRLINVWQLDDDKKQPIATVTAASEPSHIHTFEKSITVLTKDGFVYLYDVTVNGTVKPLKYSVHLSVVSDGNKDNILQKIPIVDAQLINGKNLLIAYGFNSNLVFEEIKYINLEKETVLNRKILNDNIRYDNNFQIEKNVIHKGSQVEYIDDMHVVKKRHIPHNIDDMTVEATTEQPKADNMAHLLSQALKFQDKNTINYVLQISNVDTIRKTIEKLSHQSIMPLIAELMLRVSNKSQGALTAITWMNFVFIVHMTYLMNTPDIKTLLAPLNDILTNRAKMHHKLFMLLGKINLVESQISQNSNNQSDLYIKPEVVYDDESTDDENNDMEINDAAIDNDTEMKESDSD